MTLKEQQTLGYQEATNVDRIINRLMELHPPSPKTAMFWRTFGRTVSSGIDIILHVVSEERTFRKIEL